MALVTMFAQPGFLVGKAVLAAMAFRPGDMLHCSHAFSLAFLTPFFSCLGTSNGVVYLEVVSRMSSLSLSALIVSGAPPREERYQALFILAR